MDNLSLYNNNIDCNSKTKRPVSIFGHMTVNDSLGFIYYHTDEDILMIFNEQGDNDLLISEFNSSKNKDVMTTGMQN